MSKKCARCEKTVYPAEELKCLDKSWHKQCFKCWDCGMTLTMKNYKGFNKLPYCNAHYPQITATSVADTPENRRIQKMSNLVSQAVYHKDFQDNIKGQVTSVAEDNDMRRAKQVGSVISPSAYSKASEGERSYTQPMRSYGDDDDIPPPQNIGGPMMGGGGGAPAPPPPRPSGGPTYMALYDYDAADDDEVSFQENDTITNLETVDEGWVMGTVERTGQRGMIPANYLEEA